MAKNKIDKFRAPKCPVCNTIQRASSHRNWCKGVYACRCNSIDYSKASKEWSGSRKTHTYEDIGTDDIIEFTVPLNPAIKKNSPRITKMGATYSIRPSLLFEVWAARILKYLEGIKKKQKLPCYSGTMNIAFKFYRDSKRIADLSNLYEGIQDCMQVAGIIEDDHLIESHDGSRKYYDKDNPRIEVTITKFKG